MDNVNFLPHDYLKSLIHRRTTLICLILFVIVMGGVIGAFLITNSQRSNVRRQQYQVDSKIYSAAKRLETLTQLQNRKYRMIRKATITAALLETVPRSNVLAELINSMPLGVTIVEIDLTTQIDRVTRAKTRTSLDVAKANSASNSKLIGKTKTQISDQSLEIPPLHTTVLITLTGTALTDIDVADYMTVLSKSALFEKVKLQFSEQMMNKESPLRKFKVEMQLNQDLHIDEFSPLMVRRELGRNHITGGGR